MIPHPPSSNPSIHPSSQPANPPPSSCSSSSAQTAKPPLASRSSLTNPLSARCLRVIYTYSYCCSQLLTLTNCLLLLLSCRYSLPLLLLQLDSTLSSIQASHTHTRIHLNTATLSLSLHLVSSPTLGSHPHDHDDTYCSSLSATLRAHTHIAASSHPPSHLRSPRLLSLKRTSEHQLCLLPPPPLSPSATCAPTPTLWPTSSPPFAKTLSPSRLFLLRLGRRISPTPALSSNCTLPIAQHIACTALSMHA